MTDPESYVERLPDGPMRDALRAQRALQPEWAEDYARDYLAADPETQADLAQFFEDDGPEIVRQLKVRDEDGTPTAADLERGMGSSP